MLLVGCGAWIPLFAVDSHGVHEHEAGPLVIERYVQQQLARHSSGSRRKLDRFKYMQELEKDDEQVEAGVGS